MNSLPFKASELLLKMGNEHLISNWKDITFSVRFQGWDWLHLNSGIERGGKSDLSFWEAALANEMGLNFDWSPALSHVFFFEKGLAQKLMSLPDGSVAIIDEGGEVLFSRKSISHMVISLVQTLMIYGAKRIFLIINIPDWRWIDKYLRTSRVRSLARIKTSPARIVVEGEERIIRKRGFARFYKREQILRATNLKDKLGDAVFTTNTEAFGKYYPDIWASYSEKKRNFLQEKKKQKTLAQPPIDLSWLNKDFASATGESAIRGGDIWGGGRTVA